MDAIVRLLICGGVLYSVCPAISGESGKILPDGSRLSVRVERTTDADQLTAYNRRRNEPPPGADPSKWKPDNMPPAKKLAVTVLEQSKNGIVIPLWQDITPADEPIPSYYTRIPKIRWYGAFPNSSNIVLIWQMLGSVWVSDLFPFTALDKQRRDDDILVQGSSWYGSLLDVYPGALGGKKVMVLKFSNATKYFSYDSRKWTEDPKSRPPALYPPLPDELNDIAVSLDLHKTTAQEAFSILQSAVARAAPNYHLKLRFSPDTEKLFSDRNGLGAHSLTMRTGGDVSTQNAFKMLCTALNLKWQISGDTIVIIPF